MKLRQATLGDLEFWDPCWVEDDPRIAKLMNGRKSIGWAGIVGLWHQIEWAGDWIWLALKYLQDCGGLDAYRLFHSRQPYEVMGGYALADQLIDCVAEAGWEG